MIEKAFASPMAVQLFRLVLIALYIASAAGCATSRPEQVEAPISPEVQYDKARAAFHQKDYQRAAVLLRSLAEQGHAKAQYALGYMYYNGQGVPRNYALSIQWFSVAAAKGNERAKEALRRLAIIEEGDGDRTEAVTVTPRQVPVESADTTKADEQAAQALESPRPSIPQATTPQATESQLEDTPAEKTLQTKQAKDTEEVGQEVTAETTASEAATTEATTQLTDAEQWIMSQPGENYTIQIVASGNEAAVQRFITEHNLQDTAVYYRSQRDGSNWFTLILGSFETLSLAKSTLSQLAPSLQMGKPWIKPIAHVQEALTARNSE